MMWTVHISSKEPGVDALIEKLASQSVSAVRTDLQVCDVAFVRDGRTYVHAEMKKYTDLVASVKDCRYHEQSAAMAEARVPYTFYLVRDIRPPPMVTQPEQIAVQHAMTRVQLSGPLPSSPTRTHMATVYMTADESFLQWIIYVHKILVDDPQATDGVVAPLCEHVVHSFGTKPSGRDQRRVHVEMLSRISGIGYEKARSLGLVFPSMKRLLDWLMSLSSSQDLMDSLRLKNLSLTTTAARAMYTQLLDTDEQPFVWTDVNKRRKTKP
jgi:ERCC4-type nuclease